MKILITGSNGLLGQKLIHLIASDTSCELIATSKGPNRTKMTEGYVYETLDLTDSTEAHDLIFGHEPDAVINTAAMTNVDACEDNKKLCDALNVEAVADLIEVCEQIDAHLIHVSTDFIFDGLDGPYREDDEANPVNYYGESKLKAEELVKKAKCPWSI
jgi:dTDP-4-dehydrorhamnose reductase